MTNKIEILTGRAISTKYNEVLGKETLIVTSGKQSIIIPIDEVDYEKQWDSLVGFLGREIKFILTDEVDGVKIGSRKEVQRIMRSDVLDRLQRGESVTARVINLLKYGAYVEIDGVLTAMLKNTDFSDEFITTKEVLRKGDEVVVKMKSSTQQKILVRCIEKYTPNTDHYFETIEPGAIVTGTVKTLRPDKCFINLYPGIDGLANTPFHLELDEGIKVDFEVKKVDKINKKIRGKVVSIKY